MNKKAVKYFKQVIFLAIGIALIWFTFSNSNITFDKFWEGAKSMNYWYFGISAVFAMLSHYSRALRWKLLINSTGYDPKTKNVFASVLFMYASNIAFPRSGEIARCGTLYKYESIPIPQLLGTVFIERTFDLLTLFFFILVNNLLGLIPAAANLTGNIAVTLVLSFITLIVTNLSGNKTYWGHIFNPPGVPLALMPIMIPIEIVGIFTKPFALMIRLFANISAGHIIIMSLISLIFMAQSGLGNAGAFGVAPVSVLFVLFMYFIEVLVAFLQAYIFTLLTSLFIGLATVEHH